MAPALNIGGRDGHFLEQVMDRAARAGVSDRLRVRMSLSTDTRTGLTAENGIAITQTRLDRADTRLEVT